MVSHRKHIYCHYIIMHRIDDTMFRINPPRPISG
nr:MAG TPA: hypothetical protein [Caudoviricetes sp.]